MNYETLNLVLNLLAVGLQRETILSQVEAAKDAGLQDSEIPSFLRKMRDEAIAEAEKAGH